MLISNMGQLVTHCNEIAQLYSVVDGRDGTIGMLWWDNVCVEVRLAQAEAEVAQLCAYSWEYK